MKLPSWTYLVVFILGIGVCWYFMKGCQKPISDNSVDKAVVDSIQHQAKLDSTIAATNVKYLTDSLNKLRQQNDSLELMQKWQEGLIDEKGYQVKTLIGRFDSLKLGHDTVGQLVACDSLRNLYEGAAKIIGGYEYLSDSLIDRLKKERYLSDSTKRYIWGMFGQSNQQLFEIGLRYDKLYSDYQKVIKPKRWGIGPCGGVFATNKGAGYGIGFSLHYDLIKF